ncbi:MAG: hypothetical protein BGO98_24795 [Myxococcales bacterium 68-20]|nr:alpha/beta fold hydrolase [Myxococcales bacterium]OJY15883.1 MAG: hypothetical protein BGO98_24795 [Myxococcales bacterium 68-20]
MTPFFFGDSKRPLFGALSEPPVASQRQHGVLLCPPIGQEHVRAHWAFRQLATALARDGFHVLRFDWFGVGDSSGTLEDATLDHFVEDAATAASELRDMTGIRRVSAVGLRLGAAFAALAAADIDPYRIVYWDPVVDGAAYFQRLSRLQREILVDPKRFWWAWPMPARELLAKVRPRSAQRRQSGTDEIVGFRVPASLRRALESISPDQAVPANRSRLSIVSSRDDDGHAALVTAFEAAGVSFEKREVAVDARWDDASQIEQLLLPGETTKTIVSLLSRNT